MRCNLHACVGKSPGKHTESEHENAVALKKLNFCVLRVECVWGRGLWCALQLARVNNLTKLPQGVASLSSIYALHVPRPSAFCQFSPAKENVHKSGASSEEDREREWEGVVGTGKSTTSTASKRRLTMNTKGNLKRNRSKCRYGTTSTTFSRVVQYIQKW